MARVVPEPQSAHVTRHHSRCVSATSTTGMLGSHAVAFLARSNNWKHSRQRQKQPRLFGDFHRAEPAARSKTVEQFYRCEPFPRAGGRARSTALTRIIGGGKVGRRPTHRVGFRFGSRRRP